MCLLLYIKYSSFLIDHISGWFAHIVVGQSILWHKCDWTLIPKSAYILGFVHNHKL